MLAIEIIQWKIHRVLLDDEISKRAPSVEHDADPRPRLNTPRVAHAGWAFQQSYLTI